MGIIAVLVIVVIIVKIVTIVILAIIMICCNNMLQLEALSHCGDLPHTVHRLDCDA